MLDAKRPKRIPPALVAAIFLAHAACGASGRGSRHGDAGGQGDAAQKEGAGVDASGCPAGDTFCDAEGRVRSCLAGGVPGPAEACGAGLACRAGRCLTAACAAAEAAKSYFGCEFFAADTDNTDNDDPLDYVLYVGNPSDKDAAEVVVDKPDSFVGGWSELATLKIAPASLGRIHLVDGHLEGSGIGKAYRVRSTLPVVVYQTNSDHVATATLLSTSSSSSMVLPVHALGTSYLAMAMPQRNVPGVFGMVVGRGIVVVVATRPATRVKVKAAAGVRAGPGVPLLDPGKSFEATLDAGEMLQLESRATGDDLTGTIIEASQAVAVFSGNVCTSVEAVPGFPGLENCDKTEEQLLPAQAAGTKLMAADPGVFMVNTPLKALWRIAAFEDGTEVAFDVPAGVTVSPSALRLDRGDWAEVVASVPAAAGSTGPKRHPDFAIVSNRPIQAVGVTAARLLTSSVIGIPIDQYLPEYWLVSPVSFENHLVLMREAGTEVLLDGAPMAADKFMSAGGGFEIARLDICPEGWISKKLCPPLKVSGKKVGIMVSGYNACGSSEHAYVAGMAFRCLNATAGCR